MSCDFSTQWNRGLEIYKIFVFTSRPSYRFVFCVLWKMLLQSQWWYYILASSTLIDIAQHSSIEHIVRIFLYCRNKLLCYVVETTRQQNYKPKTIHSYLLVNKNTQTFKFLGNNTIETQSPAKSKIEELPMIKA